MSLYDDLKKKLDPETFTKVTDALGDDFNFDLVPRKRLNTVIAQRNEAREELEQFKQGIEVPKENASESGEVEAPKSSTAQQGGLTKEDLEAAVALAKAEGEKKLQELQLRYAVTAKLQAANFTDPELVLSAGLIDFSKIKVDEKGTVTEGLDDQISSVATLKPFLVSQARSSAPVGTGKNGSADFAAITSREEFMKLDTAKQLEFKQANPDVFKSFMAQL